MSAPDTNLERQKIRHRPALRGIAAVVGFAVLLLIAYLIYLAAVGQTPQTPDVRVDGRTGAVEAVD